MKKTENTSNALRGRLTWMSVGALGVLTAVNFAKPLWPTPILIATLAVIVIGSLLAALTPKSARADSILLAIAAILSVAGIWIAVSPLVERDLLVRAAPEEGRVLAICVHDRCATFEPSQVGASYQTDVPRSEDIRIQIVTESGSILGSAPAGVQCLQVSDESQFECQIDENDVIPAVEE